MRPLHRRVVRGLALAICGLTVTVVPALAAAPPGATAQCRDGTYSFSQHHSGTCSHHGGVAVWLGSSAPAAGTPGVQPSSSSAEGVDVGRTVLLAPRTRTSGCRLAANPDRRCSPGAYSSGLTRSVLCSPGFRTGSIRNVPESEKFAVEGAYGMTPGHYGRALEIDHIVPLELGGSNDIANLFPERADAQPGYHAKDRLENELHDLVCAGRIELRAAQRRIAENWQALYRSLNSVAPAG
jgi:hypothetical protein